MKLSFGDVLPARFPFTDLSSAKRRPVPLISADGDGDDVIVCAITSRPHSGRFDIAVAPTDENGLKLPSRVQFDKIATLERTVIAGRLGRLSPVFLSRNAGLFRSVFGFATD